MKEVQQATKEQGKIKSFVFNFTQRVAAIKVIPTC